jgi:hypothetical protein
VLDPTEIASLESYFGVDTDRTDARAALLVGADLKAMPLPVAASGPDLL